MYILSFQFMMENIDELLYIYADIIQVEFSDREIVFYCFLSLC